MWYSPHLMWAKERSPCQKRRKRRREGRSKKRCSMLLRGWSAWGNVNPDMLSIPDEAPTRTTCLSWALTNSSTDDTFPSGTGAPSTR